MTEKLYKSLIKTATPLLKLHLRLRVGRGKEIASRLHERTGETNTKRPEGLLFWLHAASVGESLSALPLIDKLLKQDPALHILVTTGTVTSAKLMAQRLPERTIHQFIPLDHPDWIEKFLNHWQPRTALIIESEVWPNMLLTLRQKQIPTILINARLSKKSYRRWWIVPNFARTLFSTYQICFAQSAEDALRFQNLGAQNVKLVGNLKYAANPLPCDDTVLEELKLHAVSRPRWLFASTHKGEEELALNVHQALKNDFPDLLTIIAPRHPDRGPEIVGLIKEKNLSFAQRSKKQPLQKDTQIYLADTMGELGLFFSFSKIVAMGGSFIKHGGHNPIEPAQFGCAILYGPHMFNFETIVKEFNDHKAALTIKDKDDLIYHVRNLLQQPANTDKLSQQAQTLVTAQANVLQPIMAVLAPFIHRWAR